MKVEYINPFIVSSIDILKQVCNISVSKNQLFVKKGFTQLKDVTISVGVTGDIKGNFVMGFDRETAMNIASIMMGGFPVTEFNEITASAVSEICNMIGGQSGIHFSDINTKIDITPPMMQINREHATANYANQTICVPLSLDIGGTLELDVCII
ncbi:chemotaxis protein CheX [Clostridium hydrogenum]|uniref:chemotaxis protein CheX n=1 Tax=Clostridium hydrogenum TaxID=2855764 RepID=UPI001F363831|nr:chemotaxis protein CheX [Clostridium hydrogenum]